MAALGLTSCLNKRKKKRHYNPPTTTPQNQFIFNIKFYWFNNRPNQHLLFPSLCQNQKSQKVSSCNIEIQTKWGLPVSFVGVVTSYCFFRWVTCACLWCRQLMILRDRMLSPVSMVTKEKELQRQSGITDESFRNAIEPFCSVPLKPWCYWGHAAENFTLEGWK